MDLPRESAEKMENGVERSPIVSKIRKYEENTRADWFKIVLLFNN